jgi:hypothetical protein
MAAASLCKNGATASSVAPFRFAPPWWPPAWTQTFERGPIFLIPASWAGVLRHPRFDLADVRIPY